MANCKKITFQLKPGGVLKTEDVWIQLPDQLVNLMLLRSQTLSVPGKMFKSRPMIETSIQYFALVFDER